MNKRPTSWLKCLIVLTNLAVVAAGAAEKKTMPKEDVVEVPAIGQGLCVANVFQSNMVLQRDKPLNVWGWAEPGEELTVSFAGQQAAARAATDRSWQVILKPTPANTAPQTMTVKAKTTTLILENTLVGDVWILGSQSNMEFPISRVDDGELEIVSANFPQIRLLTVPVGKGFDSVRSFERLTAGQFKQRYSGVTVKMPDIPVRRLPVVENKPGRFGAYDTKLKYYPGWDNTWPVESDPDVVVCFDKSAAKPVFWRGIRYDGSDLVVFAFINGTSPVQMTIHGWHTPCAGLRLQPFKARPKTRATSQNNKS